MTWSPPSKNSAGGRQWDSQARLHFWLLRLWNAFPLSVALLVLMCVHAFNGFEILLSATLALPAITTFLAVPQGNARDRSWRRYLWHPK